MTVTQSLLLYAVAAGLLTVTPGLDTAFVLRTSATQGPRPAAFAALGVGAGCLVWGLATATGLTALFTAAPLAFEVLKWVGTAYLVWLGLKLILSKGEAAEARSTVEASTPTRAGLNAFRRGFLTNILNPKVGVFYVTFLPQFTPAGVQPGLPAGGYMVLLAGLHVLMGLVWGLVLIGATVPLSKALKRPPVVKAIDRITGCALIGFGAKLALSRR